jgi:hypothetical protein
MPPTPSSLELHPLETEVSPEERDRFFDRLAREVVRRRMAVPTILALEMHRPLAFLGSQALIVLTPLLAPAIGLRNMQAACALLAQPGGVDHLVDRIEELAYGEAPPPNAESPLPTTAP